MGHKLEEIRYLREMAEAVDLSDQSKMTTGKAIRLLQSDFKVKFGKDISENSVKNALRNKTYKDPTYTERYGNKEYKLVEVIPTPDRIITRTTQTRELTDYLNDGIYEDEFIIDKYIGLISD